MSTRLKKGFGIALLAGAPVAGAVLHFSGVRLFTAHFERLSSSAGNRWSGGVWGNLDFRWPFLVLVLVALLGLWLLIRSNHEKP